MQNRATVFIAVGHYFTPENDQQRHFQVVRPTRQEFFHSNFNQLRANKNLNASLNPHLILRSNKQFLPTAFS